MIIRHYRTLRDAEAARDTSNQTRRFNRPRQDAGMHGPIDDEYGNGAGLILWGIVGALVLWIVLTLILGWTA